jgi:hypothetical protein
VSNHTHDNHVVVLNPAGFILYHVGWKLNKLAIMTLELDRKDYLLFFHTDNNKRGHRNTLARTYTQATYYLTFRKIKENFMIVVLSSSLYVTPVVLPEDTVT